MWTMKRVAFAVIAVVLMSWVAPALAQQAAPPQGAAPKAEIAMGELVRVDTAAKTISVRPEKGEPMVFTYTDATKVTGAGDSVAGLATMAGTSVTVHYTKVQQNNVASQIEVQKKAS